LYLKDCHLALFLGQKPEVYTKRQILPFSGAFSEIIKLFL